MNGNPNVVIFFLVGALVFALLAVRFLGVKKYPHKAFGFGMAFFALAFLVWAGIVASHPEPLDTFMSLGVLPFVAAFFALVASATYDWTQSNRRLVFVIAVVYLVGLFALRTWALPSTPGFSENGLIYFNAAPAVTLMYALAFAGSFMPALHVVTREIPNRALAALTRIFFNLVVLTGVILMVSLDDNLQNLNGVLMLAGLLGLLVLYVPTSVKAKLSK